MNRKMTGGLSVFSFLACLLASISVGAEPPGFAQPPSATREGDTVKISFAVKAPCDAAAWVEDAGGKTVRHLVAGVLGDNPPDLFKKGLVQELEWDGKDDFGKAAPAGCKVKVGLGLTHKFDRIIGWDPKAINKIYSVAVGPKGEVFVLWAQPETVYGPPQVAVLDRDGKYLRTILPCPASLLSGKMAGIRPINLADGTAVPRVHQALACTFYPWLSGACRQTMTVTAGGKLILTNGWFNYSSSASCGSRRLLAVNLDGSCPEDFAGPLLDKARVEGYTHLAAAPDGKTVYVSGLYSTSDWSREHLPVHAVLKVEAGAGPDAEAAVFFGERGKAGSDESHLSDPRGVAVDADGNVYVADRGNNRIVKLDKTGKFLGAAKVENPDAIALNRKTGAIYVVSVDHGKDGVFHPRGWLGRDIKIVKLKSWAEPKTAASIEAFTRPRSGNALTIAVDDEVSPAVLWIGCANPNTYHGDGRGLFRCLDQGDSFTNPECVLGPGRKPSGLAMLIDNYMTVDPLNERLHVRTDSDLGWLVFDGRTGAPVASPKVRPVGAERAFDRQGRLYCDATGFHSGKKEVEKLVTVARFGPNGEPVAFNGTGSHHTENAPGSTKSRPRGFSVAPSGDIYVLHYPDNPWREGGFRTTLSVYGPDGKIKRQDVVTAPRTAASPRVDRAGNIYLAENIKKPDEPVPAELDIKPPADKLPWTRDLGRYGHNSWYPWMYGSVVKFGPEGGRIEAAASGEYLLAWTATGWDKPNGPARADGAKWVRGFMAPVPASGQACVCGAGRFDLDGFDRIYVPDAGRCRINVLDTAGNELCHFGGYGNMDSQGSASAVSLPEIPLAWPGVVATSPEAVYVGDWLNVRVVRVKPAYAVSAECPAP
ncbi:MAG: hypothetical protein V1809_07380 [Planctomycetota bacterium]